MARGSAPTPILSLLFALILSSIIAFAAADATSNAVAATASSTGCYWLPSSYGECDVSCGTGLQTRSVSCYCGDDVAEESSCASLARPDIVTSCTLPCVTFDWATTEWSGCEDLDCGTGYSSRTVSCLGSNGMTIESEYCEGEQPSENLVCEAPEECGSMANATWNWGEWTSCSTSCGTGHETRNRWCIGAGDIGTVDDTECDFDGLETERECNLGACETFEWSTADYSDCSVSCGTGFEYRSVTCVSSSRGTVASGECESALGTSRPESVIRCYAETECDTYSWQEMGFGDCSATCGTGEQTQDIQCVSALTAAVVDSQLCADAAVPATVQVCEVECPTCEWSTSEYSECSTTCGLGEQVREVNCTCSDGSVDTSLTQCSGTMPDAVSTCSSGTCPQCTLIPSAWGECSATCGFDGVRTRDLTCYCDGAASGECSGAADGFYTSESCNQRDCPTYEWVASGFGDCSATCGDSFRTQTVQCVSSEGEWVEASFCSESDIPESQEACTTDACEGAVVSVGPWSSCSASCGSGFVSRQVSCTLAGAVVADSECEGLDAVNTTADCNEGPCETFEWSEGDWSDCTSTCAGGVSTRDVTCVSNEQGVVEDFHCDADSKPTMVEDCNADVTCPVYEWVSGGWSNCSASCGAGVSTLSVICTNLVDSSVVDAAYCNASTVPTSVQLCSLMACEVFGWVSGNWTSCSSTCGAGYATRSVTCVGSYGTVDVEALQCNSTRPDVSADCQSGSCPTYSWAVGQYGDCSATCDAGVESRSVWCESSLGEVSDAALCSGDAPAAVRDCFWKVCVSEYYTVDYAWSTGDYSACDVTCGTGYKTRSITCTRTDTVTDAVTGNVTSVTETTVDASNCASLEAPATSSVCDTNVMCVAPYWLPGEFSTCSASCGSGFETRTVVCYDPNLQTVVDDSECTEAKPDVSLSCSYGPCQTFNWDVSSWSNCSASCGYGIATRVVSCVSSEDGVVSSSYCESIGDAPVDHETCDSEVACVTCEWVRADWSDCSASCGVGQRTRTVTCTCSDGTTEDSSCADQGSYLTVESCFETSACETYTWVNGTWSDCSVTCGDGAITRTVSCVGASSGTVDETGMQCAYEDAMVSSVSCSMDACEVFAWVYSSWGSCSATCDFGTQTRTATCTGSYGTIDASGDLCGDSESTSRDCFPKTCEVCSWQVGTLSDCDVSCGNGVQTREVACVGNRGSVCEASQCSDTMPDATVVCEMNQCTTYSWYIGAYGTCSVTCGSGTKTRDVYCHDEEGLAVDASYCSGDHPGYDAVCDSGVECTGPSWTNGEWSDCSASCGAGTKSRTVTCVAVDGSVLDDSMCSGDAPISSMDCNLCGCESTSWEVTSWSDCSVTCGTGFQTRSTDCRSTLRGYVSASECSDDAVVDHQICVSVCYDWVAGAWGDCVDGVYTRNVYCVGSDGTIDATGANCTGDQPTDTGVCA